jgi:hypothetical protein
MNLSTSNFEGDTMSESRKIYAKMVVALGLCMSVSMGLIVLLLESAPDNDGILPRVNEARAALPKILQEPNDLVLFYGSSMTRAAFSPRQFDRSLESQGKKTTSFNFGFGGLNPYFQDILSRRIAEKFNESDRRLKLVMIEFNPFQTTKTRWDRAQPVVDSFLSVLASRSELVELAKHDLTRGVRLFNIKYVRNNISAEIITSFYGRALFPQARMQMYKDDEQTIADRRRLAEKLENQFAKEFPNYIDAQWKYSWRGGGTILEERSDETLAIFDQYYDVRHTDASMKNDRLGRINSADIEELNFEPLLVEHFINIVKNFQGIADNVEVVMLPKNSKWIHYTPEAKERLAKVLKTIEQATGVTIRNHQDIPDVTSSMYRDTTHVARYRGDVAYTKYLLKEFGGLL